MDVIVCELIMILRVHTCSLFRQLEQVCMETYVHGSNKTPATLESFFLISSSNSVPSRIIKGKPLLQ